MSGKLAPETVKPAPVIAAELMVTAELPVAVRVIVWADVVFSAMLPKLSALLLAASTEVDGPMLMAKVAEALPAVALIFVV